MNTDYSRILVLVYDDLLYELLKKPVQKVCENITTLKHEDSESSDELDKKTSLFDLFLNLSEFLKQGHEMWARNEPVFKLENFQLWFHDCVVYWMHMSLSKARARILKAVELDTLVTINETVLHSTSAVDTIEIILQQKILWKQLNWPNPEEAASFLQRFSEDICNCCDLYTEKLFEKVQTIGRPTNSSVYPEWCTAINNIQFICDHLLTLVDDFGLDTADGQKDVLKTIFENKSEILKEKNRESFAQIAEELGEIVRGQLLQLAQETQRESDSVDVLMLLLENSHELLHTGLIKKNFSIVFKMLWQKISQAVEEIVTDGLEAVQPCSFFKNIHKALDCMLKCFDSADETQLCLDTIFKPSMYLLQKHGSSTPELVCTYYKERLTEQTKMAKAPYGILTVNCHFEGLNLNINILNARELPPVNQDGKTCDAYVRVMLLPEDCFPDMKKLKTKPKKKTLFPLFDELFVVPFTEEQKKNRDIIIQFKVNSREGFAMTSQYHHIGDGFLSITQVDEEQSDVKQHQLKLSRVGRLDYDCINILERRQSVDKEAKEFLKDLKSKFQ